MWMWDSCVPNCAWCKLYFIVDWCRWLVSAQGCQKLLSCPYLYASTLLCDASMSRAGFRHAHVNASARAKTIAAPGAGLIAAALHSRRVSFRWARSTSVPKRDQADAFGAPTLTTERWGNVFLLVPARKWLVSYAVVLRLRTRFGSTLSRARFSLACGIGFSHAKDSP